MKKIIYIALVFFISITTAKAQDAQYDFNVINISQVTVNGLHLIGKDKSVLIQNFGQPVSVSQEYWEMDDVNAEKYNYIGIAFYVVKNLVNLFSIKNNKYSFSPYNIKVGANFDKLQSIFPLSYKNRKGNSLAINIKDYNRYVVIDADSNNIITKISLFEY